MFPRFANAKRKFYLLRKTGLQLRKLRYSSLRRQRRQTNESNTVFNTLKKLYKTPSAEELAREELEEAKRELLVAQSNAEFYARMVDYQTMRIRRLQKVNVES